jgi:hypothetical protein
VAVAVGINTVEIHSVCIHISYITRTPNALLKYPPTDRTHHFLPNSNATSIINNIIILQHQPLNLTLNRNPQPAALSLKARRHFALRFRTP